MNYIPNPNQFSNTSSQKEWNRRADVRPLGRRVPRTRGSKNFYNRAFLTRIYEQSERELAEGFITSWLEETAWLSSIASMTRHPLFARIVNTGAAGAKLVLERMQQGEVRLHWFPILQDITKANPVPNYSAGNLNEMAEAWLVWSQSHGFTK